MARVSALNGEDRRSSLFARFPRPLLRPDQPARDGDQGKEDRAQRRRLASSLFCQFWSQRFGKPTRQTWLHLFDLPWRQCLPATTEAHIQHRHKNLFATREHRYWGARRRRVVVTHTERRNRGLSYLHDGRTSSRADRQERRLRFDGFRLPLRRRRSLLAIQRRHRFVTAHRLQGTAPPRSHGRRVWTSSAWQTRPLRRGQCWRGLLDTERIKPLFQDTSFASPPRQRSDPPPV